MTAVKRLLYWLIAGSEGGLNRARILIALRDQPLNTNQLSERVGLNYKTVRHHLDVLEKNELVVPVGKRYGKMFFISPLMEREWEEFESILAEIGHKDLRSTLSEGE